MFFCAPSIPLFLLVFLSFGLGFQFDGRTTDPSSMRKMIFIGLREECLDTIDGFQSFFLTYRLVKKNEAKEKSMKNKITTQATIPMGLPAISSKAI